MGNGAGLTRKRHRNRGTGFVLRFLLALFAFVASPLMASPILIAHRGASGDRPEHTLGAYALAVQQGADFIEPDLVLTKDGVLVARHENEISETTDVATKPEFASRRTTKTIDGIAMSGWFTEDFTLAELKTLRAKERLPQLRPANTAYDGVYDVPTFDEVIALAKALSGTAGRPIGIYPETKHPGYFASIGLPHEKPLLAALKAAEWTRKTSPVFIQSFEVGNLKALRKKTKVRLIQLVSSQGGPPDLPGTAYADMVEAEGLVAIAKYADGIGAEKSLVLPRDAQGETGPETRLQFDAAEAGLVVHVWTMRAENAFLSPSLRRGSDPRTKGDLASEIRAFAGAGVSGFFADHVAEARAALDGLD
jgi:glycerophosphoryl diester phosphodiesterase